MASTESGDPLDNGSEGITIGIPFFPGKALWSIWAIAAVFVVASVGLSVYLIHQHLKYYTQPNHQRYVVRILCMVPIYAVFSLLSLLFHEYQLYFAFLRDTYEAYVLYMFFALCVEYGGGRDEFIAYISTKPNLKLPFPLNCFKVPTNAKFFRICQQGMLQYVIIKPIVAVWSIILEALGLYDDGVFGIDKGYTYNTVIINICVTIALYVVVIFYQSASDLLAPYQPLLKFTCIKIVVFFCFWQSVAISLAVHFGWIPSVDGWNTGEVSIGLQNFLICFEMFLIALMHIKAFPAEIYRVQAMSSGPNMYRMDANQVGSALKAFANSLAQGDMIRDTVDAFRWGGMKAMPKKRDEADGADVDLEEFATFTRVGGLGTPEPEHFLHKLTRENNDDEGTPVRTTNNAAIIASDSVSVHNTNKHAKYRSQHQSLLDPTDPLEDSIHSIDEDDVTVADMVAVLEHEDTNSPLYNYDDSQVSNVALRRN
eukprot:TRINITY_DN7215_c0_g1_i1.p1 TRINITY_DN7215_c0_g1~~TRINITY_DN7215_c0_g1_i1.p1  ORF type:complete len:483 (-),score=95.89 TRINITY_DN7215_c0_g1_i1:44-1492(-)